MHLNKYEKKVLIRLRDKTGCGPFEVLFLLEKKGAIIITPGDGEFQIDVTEAGRKAIAV